LVRIKLNKLNVISPSENVLFYVVRLYLNRVVADIEGGTYDEGV